MDIKNWKPEPIYAEKIYISDYINFKVIGMFQILSIILMIYLMFKYKDKKGFKYWSLFMIIAVSSNFIAEIIMNFAGGLVYEESSIDINLIRTITAFFIPMLMTMITLIYPIIKIIKHKKVEKANKEENIKND